MVLLSRRLNAGLLHQIGNALLEVVNPVAHLINPANDGVAHLAEAALHLLEEGLDEDGEVLGVGRRVVAASGGGCSSITHGLRGWLEKGEWKASECVS